VDQLVDEIDVSPAEAQEFALSESAEDGCREEYSVARRGRFEQEADLVPVEHLLSALPDPGTFAPLKSADWIVRDQIAALGVREEPRERL
jgi:hypothetical protein